MQRVIVVAYRRWSLARVELQEVSYEEKWGHIFFFSFFVTNENSTINQDYPARSLFS